MIFSRFILSSEAAATGASIGTDTGGWTIDNDPAEMAESPIIDDSDEMEDFEQNTDETNNEDSAADGTSGTDAASDKNAPSSEPVFKEYSFKGKVNGEEVAQVFKSQKELDRTIARGLLAPKIHEAYTQLQGQMKSLEEDAKWANDVFTTAVENPEMFFNQVIADLGMAGNEEQQKKFEAALANYVHEKYQHFAKLAAMPAEELKRYRQVQAAERILAEQARAQELKEEADRAAETARIEKEKAEFEGWKQRELTQWYGKVSDSDRETVNEYLQLVTQHALVQLNHGQKWDWSHMSKHLAKLCDPLVRLKSTVPAQSSAQKKQEELNGTRTRAQQNKEALRNMTPTQGGPKLTGDALHRGALKHIAQLVKQNQ